MGIHTGEKCFVCGQVFTDNDDVVVCPDCGTPYHRACWQKNGACVNLPLHESGKSWQPEKKAEEEAQMIRICPDCGTSCPKDATHCPHCGKPFLRPEEELQTTLTGKESHFSGNAEETYGTETISGRIQKTDGHDDPFYLYP